MSRFELEPEETPAEVALGCFEITRLGMHLSAWVGGSLLATEALGTIIDVKAGENITENIRTACRYVVTSGIVVLALNHLSIKYYDKAVQLGYEEHTANDHTEQNG